MAQRLYLPREQIFTNLAAVGAAWELFSYETGTTTPKATYSDTALSVANTNPIVADSAGRLVDIFVDDLKDYKLVLKDDSGNTIWTADPVDSKTFSVNDFDPRPTSFWGTTAGTSTVYTLTADPAITAYSSTQTFYFACHLDSGASPTIAINGLTAVNLKKYDGAGSKNALIAGDLQAGQTYEARNDGTDIVILNPEKKVVTTRGDIIRGNSTGFEERLALGAQGGILKSDGTDIDYLSIGTTGKVLTSDGSDASWEIQGRTLLLTATASASSTIDFTSNIDSTYEQYIFELVNIDVSVDNATIDIRVSTDGGSTFKSGATDYRWVTMEKAGTIAITGSGSGNDTEISLSDAYGIDNTSGSSNCSGTVNLYNPASSTYTTNFSSQLTFVEGTSLNSTVSSGAGYYNSSTAVDAIRFQPSSGNFVVGEFKLYGIKKS